MVEYIRDTIQHPHFTIVCRNFNSSHSNDRMCFIVTQMINLKLPNLNRDGKKIHTHRY